MHTTEIEGYVFNHNSDYSGNVTIHLNGENGIEPIHYSIPVEAIETFVVKKLRGDLVASLVGEPNGRDLATCMAQEVVHGVMNRSRETNPVGDISPRSWEEAISDRIRMAFPEIMKAVYEKSQAVINYEQLENAMSSLGAGPVIDDIKAVMGSLYSSMEEEDHKYLKYRGEMMEKPYVKSEAVRSYQAMKNLVQKKKDNWVLEDKQGACEVLDWMLSAMSDEDRRYLASGNKEKP